MSAEGVVWLADRLHLAFAPRHRRLERNTAYQRFAAEVVAEHGADTLRLVVAAAEQHRALAAPRLAAGDG